MFAGLGGIPANQHAVGIAYNQVLKPRAVGNRVAFKQRAIIVARHPAGVSARNAGVRRRVKHARRVALEQVLNARRSSIRKGSSSDPPGGNAGGRHGVAGDEPGGEIKGKNDRPVRLHVGVHLRIGLQDPGVIIIIVDQDVHPGITLPVLAG